MPLPFITVSLDVLDALFYVAMTDSLVVLLNAEDIRYKVIYCD